MIRCPTAIHTPTAAVANRNLRTRPAETGSGRGPTGRPTTLVAVPARADGASRLGGADGSGRTPVSVPTGRVRRVRRTGLGVGGTAGAGRGGSAWAKPLRNAA